MPRETRRIYVASSWRNEHQPKVVARLRELGYEVYDFRNPAEGNDGFHWSSIDPNWTGWDPVRYRDALHHPVAEEGFRLDFEAMEWADTFLLVQPCGRSAHLELGWAIGQGKRTGIFFPPGVEIEPELMAKMANTILVTWKELGTWLASRPLGRAADEEHCR